MRLSLHWRGRPLLAIDLTAQSPAEPDPSLDPPMGLSAAGGGTFDLADGMEPNTTTFGVGPRPESRRRPEWGP